MLCVHRLFSVRFSVEEFLLLFTCIARSKLVRSPMNNRAADVADEETEFRTLLAEQEARLNKTKVRLLTRANGHNHSTNDAIVEAR